MKMNLSVSLKRIRNSFCFLLVSTMAACQGKGTTGDEAGNAIGDTRVIVVSTTDKSAFGFTFASTNHFEGWDTNDDSLLDEKEFYESLYGTWDTDDDSLLGEAEWSRAASGFGLKNENGPNWDTSGEGILDVSEVAAGLRDSNLFAAWDTNGDSMLTEREYSGGLFEQWDKNGDKVLDEKEYDAYSTYYGS